jgi:hypothetical protein
MTEKPALLFGSYMWNLKSKDSKRLGAQQVRFLGSVVIYKVRDHIRNEAIREHLGVAKIVEDIERYRRHGEPTCRGGG